MDYTKGRITMKYRAPLLLLALCLLSQLSNAQQPPMSASTGLGPNNSFTLFVTFQDAMPKIDALNCSFDIATPVQPGQEDYTRALNCTGAVTKIDETHYSTNVKIPVGIAGGGYKLAYITVAIGGAQRQYRGESLPTLTPVPITNSEHLKFSPIKKLETKP
jgi:hypothetical protein